MALQIGEYGMNIDVTVGQSLTGMTGAVFQVKKPDGMEVEWTAVQEGDAGDGLLRYVVQSGDLDQAGLWKLHAKVTFAGGKVLIGDKATFDVYTVFNDDQ